MSSSRSLFILSTIILASNASAFTLRLRDGFTNRYERSISSQIGMSTSSSNASGEATGLVRESLKKMRGISISVGFNPSVDASTSSMDMEILSQELRKAKAASIWTSSLDAVQEFSKEQSTAKGNFPGPCSVIYTGDETVAAIEKGATSVVVEAGSIAKNAETDNNYEVDLVCKANNLSEINQAVGAGFDYAFLIPGSESDLSSDDLVEMLNAIPKSSVVVASLESMQNDSEEIARAKELASITSDSAKISGILIEDACVGDTEDLKYTAFVVENINKKSSSTFKMTGLTGAANGHFGSELSGGLQTAKWRRVERQLE